MVRQDELWIKLNTPGFLCYSLDDPKPVTKLKAKFAAPLCMHAYLMSRSEGSFLGLFALSSHNFNKSTIIVPPGESARGIPHILSAL